MDVISPPDAGARVQQTADLIKPAQDALNEIRNTFQGINRLGPVAEDTLKEFREVGKMARTTGPEIQRTAEEICRLCQNTRDTIP